MGPYGKDLNACLGRNPACGKEEILASGTRRLITNSVAYACFTLKIGTFCKGGKTPKPRL